MAPPASVSSPCPGGSIQIRLEVAGDLFDPTDDENLSEYGHTILTRLGLSPAYAYRKGCNILSYRWKLGEANPLILIAAAALLALVFGFLGNYLTPRMPVNLSRYRFSSAYRMPSSVF